MGEGVPWRETDLHIIQEADLLCTLYEAQKRSMMRYQPVEAKNGVAVIAPSSHGNLDDRQVQMRLKDLAQRMIEELCEATNELKNRPWRVEDRPTDVEAFREELIDTLHFFLEFLITAGYSPEDLFLDYFKKNAVNMERMDIRGGEHEEPTS
jgi:dimeric dUTPase (all-alpha-NTP-PPase superfamily)